MAPVMAPEAGQPPSWPSLVLFSVLSPLFPLLFLFPPVAWFHSLVAGSVVLRSSSAPWRP